MAEVFVVHKDDTLDEIEYSLGLQRGEIEKFWHSSSLKAEVHSDMVELFRRRQWTLVPSPSTVQVMLDLFEGNHARGTHNRTRFTDVIPELPPGEYFEYTLMGLKQPRKKVFHAAGKPYAFPYYFPKVRTRIHPCFMFPSLVPCMNTGTLKGREHLHSVQANIRIIRQTYLLMGRMFYLSFLGNTKAKDFPGRRTPFVRRDPIEVVPTQPDITVRADPAVRKAVTVETKRGSLPPARLRPATKVKDEASGVEMTSECALRPEPVAPESKTDALRRKRKIEETSSATEDNSSTQSITRRVLRSGKAFDMCT